MSIASVASPAPAMTTAAAVSRLPPAPNDQDGDGDNGARPVKASNPPGVGGKIDIKA